MQGLNPKIINILAKQQAELANKAPDGKFSPIFVIYYKLNHFELPKLDRL